MNLLKSGFFKILSVILASIFITSVFMGAVKKEEIEIAITTNEITDISIEIIKELAKQYKRLTVVTNHIEKFKKIEKQIFLLFDDIFCYDFGASSHTPSA